MLRRLIEPISNEPMTISMANTGQPNSGGSQFFLNVANNKNLDWFSPGASKHPVFGKLCTKADFELAVKISKVRTRDDNPVEPIKMLSVTIRNLKSDKAARPAEAAADGVESPTKKLKSPDGPAE